MGNNLVILNLVVALFGGCICVCRMGVMQGGKTKFAVVLQYNILFTALCASALSWAYGDPADVTQTVLTAAIVLHLVLGFPAWKRGAPAYTRVNA